MASKGKLFWAKTCVILGAIPFVIWAHDYGPDPGKSGVPGESSCTESSCHVGTALNGGPGNVTVTFPGGLTYVPGVKQHLKVTINDPTERKAGFQLTARQTSNTKAQAGAFKSTDGNTLVMCSDTNLAGLLELDSPGTQTCPNKQPLSYIEHNLTGASRVITTGSQTYEFDWYPPATNAGNLTIYVQANGANGDGTERGDHIYSKTYTLTPASACPAGDSPPSITSGEIRNAASIAAGIVPNAWLQIKGTNFSKVALDLWSNTVGPDGQLPTSLDCVSVSVGGQPAYVYFVSPTQINVLAPNVGFGSMAVTVTNSAGTSTAQVADSQEYGPAFFVWPGNQAVATRTDYSLAVKDGTFAGTTTVAAKPGDNIILWGNGFGPTSPPAPVGTATPSGTYLTASPVTVTLGGQPVAVYSNSAVLASGNAGLYLLVITVPSNMADGDFPVVATVNGVPSPPTTVLTVKK